MLYMPATTLAAPMVLQGTQPVPLQSTTRYYVVPQATATTTTTTAAMLPTMPLLNTAFVYPTYGLLTKPVENVDQTKAQIQHVVHHNIPPCSTRTCTDCCELCCPWNEDSTEQQRKSRSRSRSRSCSRSPSPSTHDRERQARRDLFDRTQYDSKIESIEKKIELLRLELNMSQSSKEEKATETVDYYHPPPKPQPKPIQEPPTYKQHYDAPKPRPRSRSSSAKRASSLPREPWRSTNQNDYAWRDAHLPAYREATLARAQTPVNETRTWNETTQEPRSHSVTRCVTPCHTITDYSCRPPNTLVDYTCRPCSATVVPVSDTRVINYGTPSTSSCYGHSFYSDIPAATKTHHLRKIDATPSHNVYGCNEPCLHVVPKQGSASNPPYMKIHNAPVTYLH